MMRFIMLALICFNTTAIADKKPVCSLAQLTDKCNMLNSRNHTATFKDGTLIFGAKRPDPGSPRMLIVNQERVKRTEELFRATVDSLRRTIEAEFKKRPATANDQVILDRLAKVHLAKIEPENPAYWETCREDPESAGYSTAHHSFYVCPDAMIQPDFDVVFTIAHELAHAVDPCTNQLPMFKIDRTKLSGQWDQNQKKFADLTRLYRTREFARTDPKCKSRECVKLKADLCHAEVETSQLELLSTNGSGFYVSLHPSEVSHVKEVLEPHSTGIEPAANPLSTLVDCVNKNVPHRKFIFTEKNFRKFKAKDFREARILEALPLPTRNPFGEVCQFQRDGLNAKATKELIQNKPGCFSSLTGDQLEETFSDTLATNALADIMTQYPDLYKNQYGGRLAPVAQLVLWACEIEIRKKPLDPIDSHLTPNERLEKILFRHPKIAAHLGCEAPPLECFDSPAKPAAEMPRVELPRTEIPKVAKPPAAAAGQPTR